MDASHCVLERTTEAGVPMRFDDGHADKTLRLVCGFGSVHDPSILDVRRVDLHPALLIKGGDIGPDHAGYLQHASSL
jgi:hypothetical protein